MLHKQLLNLMLESFVGFFSMKSHQLCLNSEIFFGLKQTDEDSVPLIIKL